MTTKFLGHSVHQILIVFPLGLLTTSIVFDLAYLGSSNGRWADISFWLITAGLISGAVAAVYGVMDYLQIPLGTRAKRVGLLHGVGNAIVVLLFLASFIMRADDPVSPEIGAIMLSLLGVLLAGVTGWLGGELVNRLGVGVDEGAHLNSPSSLSGRPAREHEGEKEDKRPFPRAANL